MKDSDLSIILPCLNEVETLPKLIHEIENAYPNAELIVVDDGSSPPIKQHSKEIILRHPITLGNGAAIKTGARHAHRDYFLFMDSDGQHDGTDIPRLIEKIEQGYDLVVGARTASTHASLARRFANLFFNKFASLMTGFNIQDLTSGFRIARGKLFRNFIYLLPNGFSYPTTSTMAFLRCGYAVAYTPINARNRPGKSNIKMFRDGIKFLIIILRIGSLFSPMRLFLPLAGILFLIGTGWYLYTYISLNRFTNMGAVLYLSSLLTFLFGLVSEQISALHYRNSEERRRSSYQDSGRSNVGNPSGDKKNTQ